MENRPWGFWSGLSELSKTVPLKQTATVRHLDPHFHFLIHKIIYTVKGKRTVNKSGGFGSGLLKFSNTVPEKQMFQ